MKHAKCCWNCKHAHIFLPCDDAYVCRCTLNAGKEPRPSNPMFKDGHTYDSDTMAKYYDALDKWEDARPKVEYGDICDSFEANEALE